MGNATTPILLWKRDDLGRGDQDFFVGMPPFDVPATLVHEGNYDELVLSDDRVGGFALHLYDDGEDAEAYVDRITSFGEDGLSAHCAELVTGESIVLLHDVDLDKGFHTQGLEGHQGRVDLRGSWGMTLDEIAAVAPEAVTAPAPAIGR